MAEGDRRTFSDYKTDVLHSLGNPSETEMSISPGTIVNDALEHIAAMHPWNWLTVGEMTLDITENQNYVVLPDDFGILNGISHAQSWTQRFTPVGWMKLLEMRTQITRPWLYGYWYTICYGNVETGHEEVGLSMPTLELYPTPSASTTDAIHLTYTRFLRRMIDATDRPQWPSYMDRPLSLLARAFAATDYDDNPQSAYSMDFRTMIADAITRDGLSVASFGVPEQAMINDNRASDRFWPTTIPGPV